MKITPIHDNILVSLLETKKEEMSKKGIITALAQSDKNDASANKGIVLALGDGPAYGKSDKPKYSFSVGDMVFFKEYSGVSFEDDGVKYKIISYEDVVAYQKETKQKKK